ncbi:MAG: hypothetical protein IPH44_10185 [Myxococcales bacterium]|nr:hypothetical protein [Myxococcales bacterium]
MQPRRWSGVVAAALVVGWAGPASAGEAERAPPPIALTYDAPAACSEAQLRDELDARVPGARVAPDAAVVVIARIVDSREGYLVELTVIAPGEPAERRLFPPSATCVDATDALAGAIAGHLAALPPPALAPGARPAPLVRRPVARFELGGGGEVAGAGGTALVVEAGYLRSRGPWWAGGGLRLQTRSVTDNPGGFFSETTSVVDLLGLARVCVSIGPLEACGHAGAGLRQTSHRTIGSSSTSLGGFGAAGARLGVALPLNGRVALVPWVDALMLTGQHSHYGLGGESLTVVVAGSLVIAIDPPTPKSRRHP